MNLALATINGQPIPGLLPAPSADVSTFGRRIDNAQRAARWLAEQHQVPVISLTIDRRGATLTVPCDQVLWRIFKDHCAWQQRRQVGRLTIYTWVAVAFATRIQWEEVQCR